MSFHVRKCIWGDTDLQSEQSVTDTLAVRDLSECVGRTMDTYGAIVLTAAFEGWVGSYWSPNRVNMCISTFMDGILCIYVCRECVLAYSVQLLWQRDLQTTAVFVRACVCVCVCVCVCANLQRMFASRHSNCSFFGTATSVCLSSIRGKGVTLSVRLFLGSRCLRTCWQANQIKKD